jgi:hypothetical protein
VPVTCLYPEPVYSNQASYNKHTAAVHLVALATGAQWKKKKNNKKKIIKENRGPKGHIKNKGS